MSYSSTILLPFPTYIVVWYHPIGMILLPTLPNLQQIKTLIYPKLSSMAWMILPWIQTYNLNISILTFLTLHGTHLRWLLICLLKELLLMQLTSHKTPPLNTIPPSVSKGAFGLTMPEMINLEESGLCRSPRLIEKAKLQSTFLLTSVFCSTAIPSLVYESLSLVASAVDNISSEIDLIEKNFDSTFNCSNGINLLNHVFTTGKENNKVYTFRNGKASRLTRISSSNDERTQ